MITTISKALTWSELSTEPVLVYVDSVDEYAVAWHGIITSLANARCAVANNSFYIPITPGMKYAAYDSLTRIIVSGALGPVDWLKHGPDFYHSKLTSLLALRKAFANKMSPVEYLRAFDTSTAIREEPNND
jgi:hypothetical protein